MILARVYDPHATPVDDGTDVTFTIAYGPGGGEYLNTEADGYGPVVRQTIGGAASVSVNAGTKPGTILLSIESGDGAAATAKIGVSAGPPDSILVNVGEGVINGDGTYTLSVAGIVRDMHNNPVENGTVVYFTLEQPNLGFINPETYTGGNFPCVELQGPPIKGLARACLTYPSQSVFEPFTVTASTSGGQVQSSESWGGLPIFDGSVTMQAVPSSANGTTGDTLSIYVTVWDHYLNAIDNANVVFSVDGDGYVTDYSATTDYTGMPLTTLIIPPLTEEGKTKVKAKVWMIDVEGEIEINIFE
jgi:hypothetical protein